MRIWSKISTVFKGVHHWPEAPEGDHVHLRSPHRHLFHVTVWIGQTHANRDIEFLEFKDWLDLYLSKWPTVLGFRSCEMMAAEILEEVREKWGRVRPLRVEVLEDGENGALVESMTELWRT